MSVQKAIFRKIRALVHLQPTGLDYWKDRVDRYGKRAVIDLRHEEGEYDSVTVRQIDEIFPRLESLLDGSEKRSLDFGCGPGRFSPVLAETTGAEVVAVDPMQKLLDLAPRHARVQYQAISPGPLPFESGYFDLIFICLVMGGIPDGPFEEALAEIDRCLRPGGLLFAVENTTSKENLSHWTYRTIPMYLEALRFAHAEHHADYTDNDDIISIFAGRK